MGKLYLLYHYDEWCEKTRGSLKIITSDKNTLYAAIGGEILTGNMEYFGESGGNGFAAYKKDLLDGSDVLVELTYGIVKEMDEALLSEPDSVPEYYTAASEFLAADFPFDPVEFDRVYNSEDENENLLQSDGSKPPTNILCDCCIRAIRSRGKTVYVGEAVRDDDENVCKWCGETKDEIFAVIFEHTPSRDVDAEESDMER